MFGVAGGLLEIWRCRDRGDSILAGLARARCRGYGLSSARVSVIAHGARRGGSTQSSTRTREGPAIDRYSMV